MTQPPGPLDSRRDTSPPEILIFTSPKAGSGAGRDRVGLLAQWLSGRQFAVNVTSSLDELRHRTDPHTSPHLPRMVVAAGGDGTLSLVAQNTPPATTLVPMPLGTENLVAKHYRITSDLVSMQNVILHGQEMKIDAGLANGRLFLVMASCGFDAEVVRAMHLTRRGHINRFSYTWPILRTLRSYQFPPITVEYLEATSPVLPPAELTADSVPPPVRETITCRWCWCSTCRGTRWNWPSSPMRAKMTACSISARCSTARSPAARATWAESSRDVIFGGRTWFAGRSPGVASRPLRESPFKSTVTTPAACRWRSVCCRDASGCGLLRARPRHPCLPYLGFLEADDATA